MKNTSGVNKDLSKQFELLFTKAIDKFLSSICLVAKSSTKEYFKHTEKRLYAYPALVANIDQYDQDIKDLKREYTLPGSQKSKDIARMQSSGVRLTPDEILEGKIHLLEKKKTIDLVEINEIDRALQFVSSDQYFNIIALKYFDKKSDNIIAEELHCDDSTVRRNKNKLLGQIIVKLYGAAGL